MFAFHVDKGTIKRNGTMELLLNSVISGNVAETKSHRPSTELFFPRKHSFVLAEGIANLIILNFNLKSVHLLYSASTDIRYHPLS